MGRKRVATKPARWTKKKEQDFLNALSDTCNVTLAAKMAGVGNTTVYTRRGADAAFRDGWARAIAQGYARLEIETLERALRGSVRTITNKDGSTETQVEYSDRVALTLLRMHRDMAEVPDKRDRQDARMSAEEVEELRARLAAKLERVRVQAGGSDVPAVAE